MRKPIFLCVLLCAFMVASHLASSKVWAGNIPNWTGETADMDFLNRPHFRFHGDIEEAKTLYMQAWHYLQNMKQSVAPGLGVQGPFRRIFDDGTEFLVRCVAGVDMIEIFVPEAVPSVSFEEEEKVYDLMYYKFQLRRPDDSIIDPREWPPYPKTKKIEGFPFWERLEYMKHPESTSSNRWPYWQELSFRIHAPGDYWNWWYPEQKTVWIETWLFPYVLIIDTSRLPLNSEVHPNLIEMLHETGLLRHIVDEYHAAGYTDDNHVQFIAFDTHKKEYYAFFERSDPNIKNNGLDKQACAMVLFDTNPNPYYPDVIKESFASMHYFAPTQKMELKNGRTLRYNNRFYDPDFHDFQGRCGNPNQDLQKMCIYPGDYFRLPPEDYIIYMPQDPMPVTKHHYTVEGLDDLYKMEGPAHKRQSLLIECTRYNLNLGHTANPIIWGCTSASSNMEGRLGPDGSGWLPDHRDFETSIDFYDGEEIHNLCKNAESYLGRLILTRGLSEEDDGEEGEHNLAVPQVLCLDGSGIKEELYFEIRAYSSAEARLYDWFGGTDGWLCKLNDIECHYSEDEDNASYNDDNCNVMAGLYGFRIFAWNTPGERIAFELYSFDGIPAGYDD